jgi:hypothetical protein
VNTTTKNSGRIKEQSQLNLLLFQTYIKTLGAHKNVPVFLASLANSWSIHNWEQFFNVFDEKFVKQTFISFLQPTIYQSESIRIQVQKLPIKPCELIIVHKDTPEDPSLPCISATELDIDVCAGSFSSPEFLEV